MFYIAAIIILGIIYFDVNCPKVFNLDITSKKLKKGSRIRILQISDYHNANFNGFILSKLEELKPDIVVITGDLIDRGTRKFDRVYGLIDEVVKINPSIYFVSGNHEWGNKRVREFLKRLEASGVCILNNDKRHLTVRGENLNLCGIDDLSYKHSDIGKALSGIKEEAFTVLLSHEPCCLKGLNGADLILSGHTHGGQIRLPLLGAILVPGQGMFPRYSKGLYKLKSGTKLYIDSGVGCSRIPVRFLNRSQVSVITVVGSLP